MSSDAQNPSQFDDTISTEDDILGSSVSISIRDNSVHVKEKLKTKLEKEAEPPPQHSPQKKDQWWLRKPKTEQEPNEQKNESNKEPDTPLLQLEDTSSVQEFIKKENMCKKDEVEAAKKDDTLQDVLASIAFDKYQSDAGNATDEDIGSIIEEMNKIAGMTSPIADPVKTAKTIDEIMSIEEESVKELLEEAEKLVQQNGNNKLKDIFMSETKVPDANDTSSEDLKKVRQLEVNIFKMIEDQVKENSDQTDKKSSSPSIEEVFDTTSSAQKIDTQKKKLEERKTEVTSSDHDDFIERHSESEKREKERQVEKEKKESLKEEITDVDKDFFQALIEKTKESAEQLSSRSSSLDQEDFTHFLKLLQEQSHKEAETISKTSSLTLLDQFDPLKEKTVQNKLTTEPKKTRDAATNSPMRQSMSLGTLRLDNLPEESPRHESSRSSSGRSSRKNSKCVETKKIINDKNELYTVGLTPRLELFADDIPKLLAEKSTKKEAEDKKTTPKAEESEDFSFKNFKALDVIKQMGVLGDHQNVTNVHDLIDLSTSQYLDSQDFACLQESLKESKKSTTTTTTTTTTSGEHGKTVRVMSATEERMLNQTYINKSRSYDQFSKATGAAPRSTSMENMRSINNKPTIEMKKSTIPAPAAVLPKKQPPVVPRLKMQQLHQKPTSGKLAPKTKFPSRQQRKDPILAYRNDIPLDVRGSQIRAQDDVARRNSLGGGDWLGGALPGAESLEQLYQEERQRFRYLKSELEAEIETHKAKLKDAQQMHEQEMFLLKKQNIILKAKVEEMNQVMRKTADAKAKYDPKLMAMQKELERQDNVIHAYEKENKRLIEEAKRLQAELKAAAQKPKIISIEGFGNDELSEKLKDLQEENVKLSLELAELRTKYGDFVLNNEDVVQQNSLLQEELDMIKDQLRAKNDFITDRLQAMTNHEHDLRKQLEDLKVELNIKTEQLKNVRAEFERFQESADPLEKEILELRTKCTYYQEKLQSAKNNCEREKQLTQKLKDQVILDNKNIMDLNRQVREMERILKRKNPDSVSALILTANAEHEKLGGEKVRLLEDRIAFLESEIKAREETAEAKLGEIQRSFSDMKNRYSHQVSELESRLQKATTAATTPTEPKKPTYENASTQTLQRLIEHRNSEPNLAERRDVNRAGPKSQNIKEDTHLLATIRGLKLELAQKEKAMTKLSKDHQELQKTNRKLQKEREKLLNDKRNAEAKSTNNKVMTSSDSKLPSSKTTIHADANDNNSNFYQNGGTGEKKMSSSLHKLCEATDNNGGPHGDVVRFKKLLSENEVLKDELCRLNKDFIALKNKRLQDLNLLQEEHEKEIAMIVKEYSIKSDENSRSLKLQAQVNSQISMIQHMKQQIDKLQDYKEQCIILKAERDHLEGKNRVLNDKIKYLSTPSTQQLQLLQEKISILQQRHETREMSLQKLVRDLLRSRNQDNACKPHQMNHSDKGQSQQLCQFRQELDHILSKLQDLTSP
ncbi:centrosomal protein of 162 kDa [Trichogramma pretiosum]|uniref:centrosomal protein of 162 kDa n=1 Tax=Trichogramma pretiosum TaxID=7493 RepID=UPI0006C9930A|nr:centrosomal protein of 162 kDa [Trichogramma pretiosum]